MKNLGSFNEESIALFQEHFESNTDFSESTEDFVDFARCQRPDGSYYGTGGQCRKGKETSATEKLKASSASNPSVARREKEKAKREADTKRMYERSAARRAADAQASPMTTQKQAQAARRAAVVKALNAAGLPNGPVAFKAAVTKELNKNAEYKERQAQIKNLIAQEKQQRKEWQEVGKRQEKDRFNLDIRKEAKDKERAVTKTANEIDRLVRQQRVIERKARNAIAAKVNATVTKAEKEARAKEPIVGTEMGGQRRLGDGDITTSPRD